MSLFNAVSVLSMMGGQSSVGSGQISISMGGITSVTNGQNSVTGGQICEEIKRDMSERDSDAGRYVTERDSDLDRHTRGNAEPPGGELLLNRWEAMADECANERDSDSKNAWETTRSRNEESCC